jgi:nucleotide sugar dehydrogenase
MISLSPYGEAHEVSIDPAAEARRVEDFVAAYPARQTAVVMGLGFVGSAMLAALANARREGEPAWNAIGVDLPDPRNYWKIARANSGRSPIASSDASMEQAYAAGRRNGNLFATWAEAAYSLADVVVVDIHLDVEKAGIDPRHYEIRLEGFLASLEVVASRVKPGALIVLETTVPPGTTETLVLPLFEKILRSRGLPPGSVHLGYSYERVMPGPSYLRSVTDFYRVYSAVGAKAKRALREFLESFVNTREFPPSEVHSPTACEMGKVLENSFRATNIALIEEWTEFASRAGVNLFEVIDAIRVRPTHRNLMLPGFGVGGYCLTKDALLADWANRNLFGSPTHLEMSLEAVGINDRMPEFTFALLESALGGVAGKEIALLGVSYLNDVADTRSSPAALFYDLCLAAGGRVHLHDALVRTWSEKGGLAVENDLATLADRDLDAVVLAVRHASYMALTAAELAHLLRRVRVVIDANDVLSDATAAALREGGKTVLGVGKGHWGKFDLRGGGR